MSENYPDKIVFKRKIQIVNSPFIQMRFGCLRRQILCLSGQQYHPLIFFLRVWEYARLLPRFLFQFRFIVVVLLINARTS